MKHTKKNNSKNIIKQQNEYFMFFILKQFPLIGENFYVEPIDLIDKKIGSTFFINIDRIFKNFDNKPFNPFSSNNEPLSVGDYVFINNKENNIYCYDQIKEIVRYNPYEIENNELEIKFYNSPSCNEFGLHKLEKIDNVINELNK